MSITTENSVDFYICVEGMSIHAGIRDGQMGACVSNADMK